MGETPSGKTRGREGVQLAPSRRAARRRRGRPSKKGEDGSPPLELLFLLFQFHLIR